MSMPDTPTPPSPEPPREGEGEEMTPEEEAEFLAALRPVLKQKQREAVAEEMADLLDDAQRALWAWRPPTPDHDNPLYYPLLFVLRYLRPDPALAAASLPPSEREGETVMDKIERAWRIARAKPFSVEAALAFVDAGDSLNEHYTRVLADEVRRLRAAEPPEPGGRIIDLTGIWPPQRQLAHNAPRAASLPPSGGTMEPVTAVERRALDKLRTTLGLSENVDAVVTMLNAATRIQMLTSKLQDAASLPPSAERADTRRFDAVEQLFTERSERGMAFRSAVRVFGQAGTSFPTFRALVDAAALGAITAPEEPNDGL